MITIIFNNNHYFLFTVLVVFLNVVDIVKKNHIIFGLILVRFTSKIELNYFFKVII